MFESIKYINSSYDYKNKLYLHTYQMNDSDFVVSEITVALHVFLPSLYAVAVVTETIIKEYESRNYDHQEIVKNLFLLNMFLTQKYVFNLNEILIYQFEFSNKKHFNKMCFNKYYDDLIKYIKKIKILC